MLKKALWFVVISAIPLLLLWFFKFLQNGVDGGIALILLYTFTIIFAIVATKIRPCNLFSLPIGFILSALMSRMIIPYARGSEFNFFDLIDIMYWVYYPPFIVIAFILAIVDACRKNENRENFKC